MNRLGKDLKRERERILSLISPLIITFILSITLCLIPTTPVAGAIDPNRQLTKSDIPDPVLFNKLVGLGDANHDGVLTIIEMESYAGLNGTLDLSNLNITNVTGLGYAKGVKSIDLSGNIITLIPNQTFIDCTGLVSIKLPAGVVSLGDSAFEGCSSLQSINLPDGLTTIGEKCFLECEDLSAVNLPSSMTTIGNSAFSRSGLTSIVIPRPQISLGVSVFNGCTHLANVTLPEGMLTIPMECFKATSGLAGIVLPQSINTLEEGAFSGSGLSGSLNLSAYANLAAIKTSAFSGTHLSEVILPNNLTELGERAFENCTLLKTITIPSKITVLNQLTFSKCTSLENVVFVSSGQENGVTNYNLQEIMDQAFYGCTGLRNVQFLQNLNKLTTIGKQAFAYCSAKDGTQKDEYGQQLYYGIQSVLLPPNLVALGQESFSNCNSLQTMTIPDKVTTLEDKTFQNCYNLQTVKLSNILTGIGANCFESCKSLNDLTFPVSLTQIGSNAFLNCANEKVKSVTVSGKTVKDYTYTGLRNISLPDNLNQIGDNAFKGCFNLNYAKLPANLTQLNNSLFEGCAIQRKGSDGKAISNSYQGLISVTLPNDLASIGNAVFRNCYAFNLDNGNFSNVLGSASLKTIGNNAFENCYQLTSVVIPQNLELIGSSAFINCKALEKVDFRYTANLKTMGSSAFKGSAISGIVRLPDSLTKVESSVFQECGNITSVEFPDGLISIGSLSFNKCSNLSAITMPASATIVYTGSQTSFRECNSFTNAMIKAVPPDCSLAENAQAVLPVKCFNEINSAEVEDENIATAQITTDSKLKIPQVVLSGVKEGKTKVILKGTIQYETGKDSNSGEPTINMFQTSVEFNVIVTATKCTSVEFDQPIRGLILSNTKGITLNPTITPADTTDARVWTSDNEAVAKVSNAGVVTPINYGTAIIKLKVGDQPEAQCQVNVCAPASSISLDKTSLTLAKGDKTTLNETVKYSSAYDSVKSSYPEVIIWTSSNNDVATVDQDGNISALANGDTVITIRADAAGLTKTCKVAVIPAKTEVSFDKSSLTLQKGETSPITMTLNPVDSPISQVKIESSDSSIAPVSVNGNVITVTAKKGGKAKISATPVNGDAAICSVTVNSPLTSLTSTPMIMKKGETRTISLVKTPSDATDALVYKSNNLKVAKVNSDGKVTAVGVGSTTITVNTKDGLLSTDCPVTVQVSATGVSLNLKTAKIETYHTVQLKATIKPSNAGNKNVKWSSSAANIATVDSNGKITAVRPGTAKITVKTEDGNYQASCAVTVISDTTPPKIVSITPKKNQKDVPLSQDIIVKFNETVNLLRHNGIQLIDSKGNAVEIELSIEDTELTIHPKENLEPSEKYTLIILKDGVEDLAEYGFKSDYRSSFTTIEQPKGVLSELKNTKNVVN
jgi:Bacterial surface proteins containing Ig-like domains